MSIVTLKVDTAPLEKLQAVMQDYVTLLGKDASQALQKAGREVDFQMYKALRAPGVRPVKGKISADAKARGFTLNTNSASYITGYIQAIALLGGYKSGYFRVTQNDGVTHVELLALGYRKGLRSKLEGDIVSLNAGSLAVVFALQLREKAAAGGYTSIEFLTYNALNRPNVQSASFVAKDRKEIGDVSANPNRVVISGYVDNAAKTAAKNDSVNKAFSAAADVYRSDMYSKVLERARATLFKVGTS